MKPDAANSRTPSGGVSRPECDLRSLPPPEPLLRSLQLADTLAPGEAATVLTPCWPEPLLAALTERGLHWRAEAAMDGAARVWLRRPDAGA